MRKHILLTALVASAITLLPQARQPGPAIQIPPSLRHEHEAIHHALEEATRAPGRVGAAAKELATVLHPHFVREQEIALPPLGLLAPLAAGKRPAEAASVLAMTDALRKELPRMLEEHTRIKAAVAKLREAAKVEKVSQVERLADDLAHHALSEEEVLYPAAIVVGDLVRAQLKRP